LVRRACRSGNLYVNEAIIPCVKYKILLLIVKQSGTLFDDEDETQGARDRVSEKEASRKISEELAEHQMFSLNILSSAFYPRPLASRFSLHA